MTTHIARFLSALLLTLVGCGHPVYTSVGTDDPTLLARIHAANRAWGADLAVYPYCDDSVDICVTQVSHIEQTDPDRGRVRGMATWSSRGGCLIQVVVEDQDVMTHELGHCLGVMHSEDTESVMFPSPTDETQTILASDFEQMVR